MDTLVSVVEASSRASRSRKEGLSSLLLLEIGLRHDLTSCFLRILERYDTSGQRLGFSAICALPFYMLNT